jgi:hypothetical protein
MKGKFVLNSCESDLNVQKFISNSRGSNLKVHKFEARMNISARIVCTDSGTTHKLLQHIKIC